MPPGRAYLVYALGKELGMSMLDVLWRLSIPQLNQLVWVRQHMAGVKMIPAKYWRQIQAQMARWWPKPS